MPPLAKNSIDIHSELLNGFRCERFAAFDHTNFLICVTNKLGIDFNNLFRQIDDPYFGNACLCINRDFYIAVIFYRAISDLDDEKDILRLRISLSIKIISRFQQGHIRQWLRMVIDLDRILYPNDYTITSQPL